jgi:hypothetical protein
LAAEELMDEYLSTKEFAWRGGNNLQLILGSRGVAGKGRNYVAIEKSARKGDSYLTLLSAGRCWKCWQPCHNYWIAVVRQRKSLLEEQKLPGNRRVYWKRQKLSGNRRVSWSGRNYLATEEPAGRGWNDLATDEYPGKVRNSRLIKKANLLAIGGMTGRGGKLPGNRRVSWKQRKLQQKSLLEDAETTWQPMSWKSRKLPWNQRACRKRLNLPANRRVFQKSSKPSGNYRGCFKRQKLAGNEEPSGRVGYYHNKRVCWKSRNFLATEESTGRGRNYLAIEEYPEVAEITWQPKSLLEEAETT